MIKAIPTTYSGVNFRSRLEARWAAFFDLAGIRWDYEPLDMEGWTPDFRLDLQEPLYAEVKPCGLGAAGFFDSTHAGYQKAWAHWRDVWVLLLAGAPQIDLGIGALLDPPAGATTSWIDLHLALTVRDRLRLWRQAGNRVQWRGRA